MTLNFLPWRENARQAKKKQYQRIAISIMLCLFVVCYLLHQRKSTMLKNINQQNVLLKQRLNKQKHTLKTQQDHGSTLEHNKQHLLTLLAQCADLMPDQLFLTKLTYQPGSLTLTGYTDNDVTLLHYRTALTQLPLTSKALLDEIKATASGITFSLKIQAVI